MANNNYFDDATVAGWSLNGSGWNTMSSVIQGSKTKTDFITVSSAINLNTVVRGVGTTKITVSDTTPSSPATGDIWIDTTE